MKDSIDCDLQSGRDDHAQTIDKNLGEQETQAQMDVEEVYERTQGMTTEEDVSRNTIEKEIEVEEQPHGGEEQIRKEKATDLDAIGVKILSISDAVPASLNGIMNEVDLVTQRMDDFLKGNTQQQSNHLKTPLRKGPRSASTIVSFVLRQSQREISAPERLDL